MTALILIQEEEVLKGTDEWDLLEKRINELSQIYNKTED
jgi:hypothetical protein